jgi:hypothetical protein
VLVVAIWRGSAGMGRKIGRKLENGYGKMGKRALHTSDILTEDADFVNGSGADGCKDGKIGL